MLGEFRAYYFIEGRYVRAFCPRRCGGAVFTDLRPGVPFDSVRCATCRRFLRLLHGFLTDRPGEDFEGARPERQPTAGRLRGKQMPLFERGKK